MLGVGVTVGVTVGVKLIDGVIVIVGVILGVKLTVRDIEGVVEGVAATFIADWDFSYNLLVNGIFYIFISININFPCVHAAGNK